MNIDDEAIGSPCSRGRKPHQEARAIDTFFHGQTLVEMGVCSRLRRDQRGSRRMRKIKKLATPTSTTPMTPSRVKIPSSCLGRGRVGLLQQAAQARARGAFAKATNNRTNAMERRRFTGNGVFIFFQEAVAVNQQCERDQLPPMPNQSCHGRESGEPYALKAHTARQPVETALAMVTKRCERLSSDMISAWQAVTSGAWCGLRSTSFTELRRRTSGRRKKPVKASTVYIMWRSESRCIWKSEDENAWKAMTTEREVGDVEL